MPVSGLPRPSRRLSLLVLGVEDALGLATVRHLEADGHQVTAALAKGKEAMTLTAKWGANMLPLLSDLAQETQEAIDAA